MIFPIAKYKLSKIEKNKASLVIPCPSLDELKSISKFVNSQMFINLHVIDISVVLESVEVFDNKEDPTNISNYRFYLTATPDDSSKALKDFSYVRHVIFTFRHGTESYKFEVNMSSGEITHIGYFK